MVVLARGLICGGGMGGNGRWAVGGIRWGGRFLGGRLGAPYTPGCARLVWLVGVSGDLVCFPAVSGTSAVGGVKKAGLRVKLLDIMVAALLERRLLLVRVLGAEVRRIGKSLPESEPLLLD